MNRINNPAYRATVAESCNLYVNIAKAIQARTIEDAYLNDKTSDLLNMGTAMQNSLANDRSKDKTEALSDLDNRRDNLLSALKLMLRGFMNWDKNEYPMHANKVYGLIKNHGLKMASENYEKQSALMDSMLLEMKKPEYQLSLNELQLVALSESLEAANTAFNSAFRESMAIEAEKQPVVAATKIKSEARSLLIEIINYLNVMSTVNNEVYNTITTEVAELINSLNTKIKTRISN
ncbi:MAG: hypothetical protein JEZ09_06550 [Salinivirgaceae bacterium]|nr:hypothetical protein [Salinivirgaceae bacterium]